MSLLSKNRVLTYIALSLTAFILSCGGGTSGTTSTSGPVRVDKVFQGVVIDEKNSPVANAVVSEEQSGESGETGSDGRFVFSASVTSAKVKLKILKGAIAYSALLPDISENAGILNLTLELDSLTQAKVQSIELILEHVGGGSCEGAFGEAKVTDLSGGSKPLVVVNQLLPLPENTICTATAQVLSGGVPMSGISALIS